MEFRLLGPFEIRNGGEPVVLPAGKPRALLARLLLDANRTVSVDQLVDDLWGEAAPGSAAKMVQIHVSQLRKALPDGVLQTKAPGYRLEPGDDEIDLRRFEAVRAAGRAALAAGDAARAAELLREALALWRGPALGEFDEPFARVETLRLEELRVAALEDRIDADLALRRHADLIGELESLVASWPHREGLRARLMLALYRSGRQVEALQSFQAFRAQLGDELGLEPSVELRELERRILQQDPSLAAPPEPAAAAPSAAPGESDVRYARSGDVSIAYQVVGSGPLDVVLVHGWVCTFHPGWESPTIARFYRRLARLGRLVLFDKRGTGLSDRVSVDRLPDLETRMDDVRAVMDAAASERAVLIGVSEGGPMSALFAATYPERTAALVLVGTFARRLRGPDYPLGETEQAMQARLAIPGDADWAMATTREWLGRVAPAAAADERLLRWYASYVARGASPGAVAALRRMNNEIDIRHVLPAIRVPTLVVARSGDPHFEASEYMAERIPGARFAGLPGNDHLPWEGDQDGLLDAVERFVGEVRDETDLDRVLATVLFTDLVGSTARAAELGDRAWRELLDRHRDVVRAQLARFRGREIDTAGDGTFAIFDGPARAVRCAVAIARAVGGLGLEIRSGLHTGEVEFDDGDVSGIAVHIGARIGALAGPGEVLVSSTVRDLVAGSGIEFRPHGSGPVELKGVPDEWRLFSVAA